MPKPSIPALQKIADSAHVPAVGYAYAEPKEEGKHEFAGITFGKKNAQFTDAVNEHTRFPASSLSKIVFTYLVLQWVKENQINLDESLHDIVKKKQIELDKPLDHILKYERFINNGKYPEKAEQLTIRHVLSHTTGLPNLGSDSSSTLLFDSNSELGEKYSYSGEAFLYLQKVIEAITGKNLEDLAKKYVFDPLKMGDSTFLPQREDDANVVAVHTELGKPSSIYESLPDLKYDLELMLSDLSQAEKGKIYLSENPREYYVKGMSKPASIPQEIDLTNLATKLNNRSFRSDILVMTSKRGHTPHLNGAGSLLTTADDFSKFMAAWLKNLNDPFMQQAFEPIRCDLFLMSTPHSGKYKNSDLKHLYLYKDEQDQIFYQLEGKKILLENNKENELSETIKKNLKFDQPENSPVACHNADIVDKTLAITSTPGHIHFKTCGLGWHIYKNKGEVIAYQYGENPNTRSFVAINVATKKGAAFFTNSKNGESIANQLLNSTDFVPIGNLQEVYKELGYTQSDELGWKETISGKIAEDQGKFAEANGDVKEAERKFAEAKDCFEEAKKLAPEDKSKQLRFEWFNAVHQTTPQKKFNSPLKTFEGVYTNPYKDEIKMSTSKEGGLIYKQFGHEIKLIRISETDFLPEKDQSFKVKIEGDQMTISFIRGGRDKSLSKEALAKSQENSQLTSSTAMMSKKLNIKIASPPPQKQQTDIENLKDNKKITKDDIAVHATKEKKAVQKFSSETEKKEDTSTDDFNITYGKRPGK